MSRALVLVWLLAGSLAPADEARSRALAARVEAFAARPGRGGQVLVALDGEVLLHRAFGVATAAPPSLLRADARMDACPIAAQLTAVAVLRLAQQGKLSPADRLIRFLAGVPGDKAALSIHQLLARADGLSVDPRYPGVDVARRDAVVAHILGRPRPPVPLKGPGEPGYVLLAAIVERASGEPFERYLSRELLEPAGMRATGFRGAPRLGEQAVARVQDGRAVGWVVDHPYPWTERGAGGVVSTAADLLAWHRALRGDTLLDPRWRAVLIEPVNGDQACGGTILAGPGGRAVRAGGPAPGAEAVLERGLERDYAIAVLLNAAEADRPAALELAVALRAILFPPVSPR